MRYTQGEKRRKRARARARMTVQERTRSMQPALHCWRWWMLPADTLRTLGWDAAPIHPLYTLQPPHCAATHLVIYISYCAAAIYQMIGADCRHHSFTSGYRNCNWLALLVLQIRRWWRFPFHYCPKFGKSSPRLLVCNESVREFVPRELTCLVPKRIWSSVVSYFVAKSNSSTATEHQRIIWRYLLS